jgi:hypothetical protein
VDPTVILVIVLAVIALWFASALIMLYIMARDSWVSADNVTGAVVFGPVSFLLIRWFVIKDVLMRLEWRVRRFARETVAKARAWWS